MRRIDGIHRVRSANRAAFTLIELLVVISILALLVSILLPSLSRARRLAKKNVCQVLHKGYGLATEMYSFDNDGVMMDSYKHLDPDVGIPRYWGSKTLGIFCLDKDSV